MLSDIRPRASTQGDLFDDVCARERRERVMGVMDTINGKWSRGAVRVAAEGLRKPWQMKRNRMSSCYPPSWDGLSVALSR